jgi:hypothetical protein
VTCRASSPAGDAGDVSTGRGDAVGPVVSVAGAVGSMMAVGAEDAVAAGVATIVGVGEAD